MSETEPLYNVYEGQFGRSGGPYLDEIEGSVVLVSLAELQKIHPNVSAPADFNTDTLPNTPVEPVEVGFEGPSTEEVEVVEDESEPVEEDEPVEEEEVVVVVEEEKPKAKKK